MKKSQTAVAAMKKGSLGRTMLACALAATLAVPMGTGQLVGQAFADDVVVDAPAETPAVPADSQNDLTIRGVDFMTVNAADGLWDLFRVENGVGKNIYLEVEKDGSLIAPRFSYQIVEGQDADGEEAADYAGNADSGRIAQIVSLRIGDMSAGKEAASRTVQQVFADPNNFPSYTVKVYDAKRGGSVLYEGTICPVYAKLVGIDGSEEWKVMGIRTVGDQDQYADTIGAGSVYYKNVTDANPLAFRCDTTNAAGEPTVARAENDNKYVVSYQQVEAGAISGALKYVDADGNIVDTELVENIGTGKEVAIKKSFFKTTENSETGTAETRYYRVIQRLNGTTVTLTPEQATKQVRVMEVENAKAGAYQVTIKYVDENGNLLWSDAVDVKGKGYQYTLPNSFSMSAVAAANNEVTTDREKGSWGVSYYTLASWSIATNPSNDNEAIQAQSSESTEGDPVVSFDAGEYPAGRTVTAVYQSQATTKEVNLTIIEINGETGDTIDKVSYTVTPEQSATYTPARKGNMVPWSGNMEPITYAWEDLEKGSDVLRYVYYVPEDYMPAAAYDITVQYMNIANSQILRSETITVDPASNDYVNILGEETVAVGSDTYVRLAGQETAIRHAPFSPARTYTIYYRDVNDELSANITIRRTQIVETERPSATPAQTLNAAPVTTTIVNAPAGEAAEGGDDAGGADAAAPTGIDVGVGTGDGETIINDDDNPLANMAGQDTATERTIVDDENPLYSGLAQDATALGSSMAMAVAAGVIVLVGVGIFLYGWMRRRRKEDQTATDSMNA